MKDYNREIQSACGQPKKDLLEMKIVDMNPLELCEVHKMTHGQMEKLFKITLVHSDFHAKPKLQYKIIDKKVYLKRDFCLGPKGYLEDADAKMSGISPCGKYLIAEDNFRYDYYYILKTENELK